MVRRYRFRAGLTQSELARRAGVSERSLRYLEQGQVSRPQAVSVDRLARALDLADADRGALVCAAEPVAGIPARREPVPATDQLRMGVLGPLVVHRGTAVVDIGSTRLRTLLGLLALQPRVPVSAGDLIDVLWDEPPRTCRELVHTYVRQLRQLLEPARSPRAPAELLQRTRVGYRLQVPPGGIDTDVFDDLLARTRTAGGPEPARDLYRQAEALWRGPVLADATDRLRQHPAAVGLGVRRLSAVLEHADLSLAAGHGDEVIEPLRVLSSADPLHEGLAARLMLAYAGCGQQAAALELFESVRTRLDDELGVRPGEELREAHLRLLRGECVQRVPGPPGTSRTVRPRSSDASPASPRPAPAPRGTVSPAQLPADVPGFTGRDSHLRHLDRDHHAGVTVITGMGGVGKTALAVHWAHQARDRYPDGQLYVNLGGHSGGEPMPVLTALAGFLQALGVQADQVPAEPAPAAALYRSLLAGRRVLILLDNAACADQVRPLLPGDPRVRVLVTSRERLTGLVAREGADALPVDGLTPAETYALLATMLGAERVAAEADAAVRLAAACGYLPLALRIAAANLAGRSGTAIADHVDRLDAGDRLTALAVAGDPDTAVRATFAMSYQGADPAERVMFRRLGLVPGPDITAAAAADLTGQSPARARAVLDRLSARHLLQELTPGRYSLHDLLRLYATELAHTTDDPETRTRALAGLVAHYLTGARSVCHLVYRNLLHLPAGADDRSPAAPGAPTDFETPERALDWLDAERANVVEMIRHRAASGSPDAWLLADPVFGYFRVRARHLDWQAVAEVALRAARVGGNTHAQAQAELNLGCVSEALGRYDAAARHYRDAHDLAGAAGWPDCQGVALNNLGSVHWARGDVPGTVEQLNRALVLHERAGRRAGIAVTLANLAVAQLELARDPAGGPQPAALARAHLRRARAMHQDIGDRRNESDTVRVLALVELAAGQPGAALPLAEHAVALAREIGDRRFEALSVSALGLVRAHLGDRAALELAIRAESLARELDEDRLTASVLTDHAGALQRLGETEGARSTARQALETARRAGVQIVARRAVAILSTIDRHGSGTTTASVPPIRTACRQ
ncbi:BTAD domain-containing putative transcriptional regulator [Virgisporangium aurantiacum]|uniref:XRE family transcriptional regulator n=1 Tax=Virgisporangium aurantiacum TaxID=175570 RepID=A0A8J3Z3T4_9ACTN|nr:BTAD domain-containing putative transcriptional regulator [Virgisporangium aurantiacum]GIJ54765.1 XRE family transcriptional regulator [Virgisporangium aurantiacum]